MAYVSLYRKYRSQTFGDLIGQDHVVRTLQNGITSGRIAHSYLFTGPRGTGKTSTARLMAKALCCEHGPTSEPDNECEICKSITLGNCVDVIEMDAASESGVDDIREQIVEAVEYKPMIARYKVFIIDEVHDLSVKAFDALLKTIEEPPEHIIFILATTEYNKVPPTIRSRCQKFEFHRASMSDLTSRLEYVCKGESVTAEPQAISAIARMADGGYRDALTLLEQAILTSEDGRITLQQVYDQLGLVSEDTVDGLLMAMKNAEVPQIMELLEGIARLGRDPRAILESMLYRLQDLTRATYQIGSGQDSTRQAVLHDSATKLGRDAILRFRGLLAEAHKVIRDITIPRLWLESELVRISLVGTQPVVVATAPVSAPAIAGSRQVGQPTPVKPAAEPKPAEPEPAIVAKPPEAPAVVREPTPAQNWTGGDNWDRFIQEVHQKSKALSSHMEDVSVDASDGVLTIEFGLSFDYGWVTEKPKVVSFIEDTVRSIYGKNWSVKFSSARKKVVTNNQDAVELPAEGDKLEQLTKEIFGLNSDTPTQ